MIKQIIKNNQKIIENCAQNVEKTFEHFFDFRKKIIFKTFFRFFKRVNFVTMSLISKNGTGGAGQKRIWCHGDLFRELFRFL